MSNDGPQWPQRDTNGQGTPGPQGAPGSQPSASPWAQGPSFDQTPATGSEPPAGWGQPGQPATGQQYGAQQYGAQQQPAQPPYPGQPQYGQSQYGQSQYGQSQYGQSPYNQPPYGQQYPGQPQYGQQPSPTQQQPAQPYAGQQGQQPWAPIGTQPWSQPYAAPATNKRRSWLTTAVVGAVALVLGVGAIALAVNAKGGGSESTTTVPSVSTPAAPTDEPTSAQPTAQPTSQAPTATSDPTTQVPGKPGGTGPAPQSSKKGEGQALPATIGDWQLDSDGASKLQTTDSAYYRKGGAGSSAIIRFDNDPEYGNSRFDDLQGRTRIGNSDCGLNPINKLNYCYFTTQDGYLTAFSSRIELTDLAQVTNGIWENLK